MKKYFVIALCFIALLISPAFVKAQATIKITGEVTTPLTLTAAELQKLEQTTVIRKDKDGKPHTYTGVLLGTLLQKAGATLGTNLHGKNLAKYVLAEATDGYQVTFALPELDKEFTDRAIILADKMDGQPLPTADGPLRIIVQDEKRPARCVKQIVSLRVGIVK